MILKLIKIFIFILFSFYSSIVFANKDIRSQGHLGCGKFLSYCDKSMLNLNCQTQTFFVQGYLSAVSWEMGVPVIDFNQDSIKYALINYCRENPLKDTQDGAVYILQDVK